MVSQRIIGKKEKKEEGLMMVEHKTRVAKNR